MIKSGARVNRSWLWRPRHAWVKYVREYRGSGCISSWVVLIRGTSIEMLSRIPGLVKEATGDADKYLKYEALRLNNQRVFARRVCSREISEKE
jgi:hypothetical protein